MINVGLFGFGKTGSVVAKEILLDNSCELKWIVRKSATNAGDYASRLLGFEYNKGKIYSLESIKPMDFYKDNFVDVIIDFSAKSAVESYKPAAKFGTRIVSAISQYSMHELEQLKELSLSSAVLYSPNITLGINFLIESSKVLQKIAPHADIEIIEEHAKYKTEVSGTALRIAEDLGLNEEKHVNSIRIGGIIGKHEVVFGLPNQTIRIIHESLNRAAFGQGALYAAKWLMHKQKGIYTMEDAVSLSFARNSHVFGLE